MAKKQLPAWQQALLVWIGRWQSRTGENHVMFFWSYFWLTRLVDECVDTRKNQMRTCWFDRAPMGAKDALVKMKEVAQKPLKDVIRRGPLMGYGFAVVASAALAAYELLD